MREIELVIGLLRAVVCLGALVLGALSGPRRPAFGDVGDRNASGAG